MHQFVFLCSAGVVKLILVVFLLYLSFRNQSPFHIKHSLSHLIVDNMTRIAVVNSDRCKPNKCRQECKKSCPIVSQGKLCIEVTSTSKVAYISEELCTGCRFCIKVLLLLWLKYHFLYVCKFLVLILCLFCCK
jgi:NAD-dependent dihydropyrimidine dehydrogenase PreA subunit